MLETDRLILRPFADQDFEAIFAIRSNAEMMKYIKSPENRGQTEHWINYVSRHWQTESYGLGSVIFKDTNTVIGWCGIWELVETREPELGWAIAEEFWNKGLASEAASAYLDYGFHTLNYSRIVAVARPENLASLRVMEKIGMKFERTGDFYDRELAYYAINRKDYD